MNARTLISIMLAVAWFFGELPGSPQDGQTEIGAKVRETGESEFLSWSRDQCRAILKRHTKAMPVSDIHIGTVMMGGIGKTAEMEGNFFVWLTEPAAKAYVRMIQLKAHLSASEAQQTYQILRPDEDLFTIVFFSRSLELGWTSIRGTIVKEGDKPDQLGKSAVNIQRNLFLTQKNAEEQAARIERIEALPDEVIIPMVSKYDTAYGMWLRFKKTTQQGTSLVQDLKDEVIVSFYRLGKPRKTTFKIKDFKIGSLNEL